MLKKIILVTGLLVSSSVMAAGAISASPVPSSPMYGAWVYNYGTTPASQAAAIKVFNAHLPDGDTHKIDQLFPYGSDMEMYCKMGAKPLNHLVTSCELNSSALAVYYANVTKGHGLGNGVTNTDAYSEQFPTMQMSPIIDGRIDNGLLWGFNSLSSQAATYYADEVATQACSDSKLDGIQFDLEPFGITQFQDGSYNGQYYFYQEISRDFSGGNPAITDCVSQQHPNGRYFSVFTFASGVNANVEKAFYYDGKEVGYLVDSLYDLGPLSGAHVNTPRSYDDYVQEQVQAMVKAASEYQLDYQFAVPFSASVHEFEGVGVVSGDSYKEVSSTYNQAQYVAYALTAINKFAVSSPYYRGYDVWAFGQMEWGGQYYCPYYGLPEKGSACNSLTNFSST